jgi:uncharacterized protein (TIGR03435 family)
MARAIAPLIALFTCSLAWAQTDDKTQFEVASIKPSPPPSDGMTMVRCTGGPGTKDPTLYTCENMSLSNLVTNAYKIAYYQLQAPDWAMQTRFHVNARVPAGATRDDLSVMLQHLLAERFKLSVHHETRDFQRYELAVAKNGPKFKEGAAPPPPKDDGGSPAAPPAKREPPHLDKDGYPSSVAWTGGGMAIMKDRARMYFPACTMARLADMLGGQLRAPVTDATGLTGKYEISLYWVAGEPAPDSEPGPTIVEAVQQQLGLRLEPKKAPLDFVIVDHAEKTPVEN